MIFLIYNFIYSEIENTYTYFIVDKTGETISRFEYTKETTQEVLCFIQVIYFDNSIYNS